MQHVFYKDAFKRIKEKINEIYVLTYSEQQGVEDRIFRHINKRDKPIIELSTQEVANIEPSLENELRGALIIQEHSGEMPENIYEEMDNQKRINLIVKKAWAEAEIKAREEYLDKTRSHE